MPLNVHRLVQDTLYERAAFHQVIENSVAAVGQAVDRWPHFIMNRAREGVRSDQHECRFLARNIGIGGFFPEGSDSVFEYPDEVGIGRVA